MSKYKHKKQLNSEDHSLTKRQRTILALYQDAENTKRATLRALKEAGLYDVLNNYYLPENFNFNKLDKFEIITPRLQKYKLPFKNSDIEIMLKMPKVQVSTPKISYSNGKIYHSTYLVGSNDRGRMVFLLSVEYRKDRSSYPCDFHIKLDALVGGKTWFSLMRIDSLGASHPNYFKDGKPCETYADVEKVRTPHLHTTSYEAQMFTDMTHYSSAEEIEGIDYENIIYKDGKLFTKLLQIFLKKCNAKVNLRDLSNEYLDIDNENVFKPLVDFDSEVINWIS